MTGLAGHAYGSWRGREKDVMWLKDFLPNNIGNIRIMSYGYDTSLDNASIADNSSMLDYRRGLVQQLRDARRSADVSNILTCTRALMTD